MTDQTATLAGALAVLQTRLPEVHKAQTATVPTKAGGSYRYTYAGLPDISRVLLPLLGELGLAWTCRPTLTAEGRFVLLYQLLHVSGEQLVGEYPLPAGGSPQEIGSAVTYGRRYCLCSITGLAADDDDDGTAASQPDKPVTRTARARRAAAAEPADVGEPIGDTQRKAIMAGFGDLGYGGTDNREARLQVAAKLAGLDTLASTNDLTAEQAARVLDGIAERRRAQVQSAGPAT